MRGTWAGRAAGLAAVALLSASLMAAAHPPADDGAVVTHVEHQVEFLEIQRLAAAIEAGEITFLTEAELAAIVGAGGLDDFWQAHCMAVGGVVLLTTRLPLLAYSAYRACMRSNPF